MYFQVEIWHKVEESRGCWGAAEARYGAEMDSIQAPILLAHQPAAADLRHCKGCASPIGSFALLLRRGHAEPLRRPPRASCPHPLLPRLQGFIHLS